MQDHDKALKRCTGHKDFEVSPSDTDTDTRNPAMETVALRIEGGRTLQSKVLYIHTYLN